jgi:transposase
VRGSCCWLPIGVSNTEIAERVGVSRPTMISWRDRYASSGLKGLGDEQRSGRPRTVDRARILAVTPHPAASQARYHALVVPERNSRSGDS